MIKNNVPEIKMKSKLKVIFYLFYREFINYNQNARNSINVTKTLALKHQKNLASR